MKNMVIKKIRVGERTMCFDIEQILECPNDLKVIVSSRDEIIHLYKIKDNFAYRSHKTGGKLQFIDNEEVIDILNNCELLEEVYVVGYTSII